MRKPTDKQFAKAHPELAGKHVKINKHSNGVTVYVNITEDLTRDEKGRVLTAMEQSFILAEDLSFARQYGKDTPHVHTYTVGAPGSFFGCSTGFTICGEDNTVKHTHTVREAA